MVSRARFDPSSTTAYEMKNSRLSALPIRRNGAERVRGAANARLGVPSPLTRQMSEPPSGCITASTRRCGGPRGSAITEAISTACGPSVKSATSSRRRNRSSPSASNQYTCQATVSRVTTNSSSRAVTTRRCTNPNGVPLTPSLPRYPRSAPVRSNRRTTWLRVTSSSVCQSSGASRSCTYIVPCESAATRPRTPSARLLARRVDTVSGPASAKPTGFGFNRGS